MNKRLFGLTVALYLGSIALFILGLRHPIMGTEMILGIKSAEIYLLDSFEYFYKRQEYFLGTILLVFTIILPIAKYLYIGITLFFRPRIRQKWLLQLLDIINKWAMLDVFIVAVLIMSFKLDSTLIHNYIMIGTTYFAASILTLMITSKLTKTLNVSPVEDANEHLVNKY